MSDIKRIKTACPMDCFDGCSLVATVSDGVIQKVEGDKDHPLTRGFCCHKGKNLVERHYHADRLKTPLKKNGSSFVEISWDQALDEIAENLEKTVREHGSDSILLYSGYGYTGILKDADRMFFNHLGGASVHKGSLCMGAGVAAQTIDFGATLSNSPSDCLNAKSIVIWGRNPVVTNIHLYDYVKRAKDDGTKIITIDPLKTATAKKSDEYIRIKPGTDGALALGICAEIIRSKKVDEKFINNHAKGFEVFREYALSFSLKKSSEITGVGIDKIKSLADIYTCKPVSTYIGFGMQRYLSGGESVRAIDALGAVSGNIGIKGGGVNYGHDGFSDLLHTDYDRSKKYGTNRRYYEISKIPEFIENKENNIRSLFISKANPLVQNPNAKRVKRTFESVPFKVVTEMFLTDTAKIADIVLPSTSVFEEEDFFLSTMYTPYLNYSEKVVEPDHGFISEYRFYKALARKMGLKEYPYISEREYLKRAVKPILDKFQITFEDLKKGDFNPDGEVAWEEGIFRTPSGKFEFESRDAEKSGLSPVARYNPVKKEKKYDLRLITPHSHKSLHSQHYQHLDDEPLLYAGPDIFEREALEEGDLVILGNRNGKIEVRVKKDDNLTNDVIMIYQGFRNKKGSVNVLTSEISSKMGEQTGFYDCFCSLSKK